MGKGLGGGDDDDEKGGNDNDDDNNDNPWLSIVFLRLLTLMLCDCVAESNMEFT